MLGDDINFLRWLQLRISSGDFSLSDHYDSMAVDRLDKLVKVLEAEQAKVPGPRSLPYHPFRRDWS